jgi:hypothetical protein
MKLTFLGATGTVTELKYLLEEGRDERQKTQAQLVLSHAIRFCMKRMKLI